MEVGSRAETVSYECTLLRQVVSDNRCLSTILCKQELLRQNDAAVTGRRFNAILEVLVKEMVRRCDARSRAPPSVSIVSLRDGVGKRKLVADSLSLPLELPRSITTGITKEAASLDGKESDISELTKPEEVQEVSQHGGGSYRSHAASIGREKKEHPKAR